MTLLMCTLVLALDRGRLLRSRGGQVVLGRDPEGMEADRRRRSEIRTSSRP